MQHAELLGESVALRALDDQTGPLVAGGKRASERFSGRERILSLAERIEIEREQGQEPAFREAKLGACIGATEREL